MNRGLVYRLLLAGVALICLGCGAGSAGGDHPASTPPPPSPAASPQPGQPCGPPGAAVIVVVEEPDGSRLRYGLDCTDGRWVWHNVTPPPGSKIVAWQS
ncbi:hypothetical protein [Micromonospora chersina]|uniref:hypothetical protein n=1 Tax=Micromonospora chersina TaxID=47854 RepID=UPI003722FFB6